MHHVACMPKVTKMPSRQLKVELVQDVHAGAFHMQAYQGHTSKLRCIHPAPVSSKGTACCLYIWHMGY